MPHVLQRGARINPCARIQNVRDLEKVWGLGVVKGAVRVVGFNINLKKFKNNLSEMQNRQQHLIYRMLNSLHHH